MEGIVFWIEVGVVGVVLGVCFVLVVVQVIELVMEVYLFGYCQVQGGVIQLQVCCVWWQCDGGICSVGFVIGDQFVDVDWGWQFVVLQLVWVELGQVIVGGELELVVVGFYGG